MPTLPRYENQADFTDPEMLYKALLGARRVAATVRSEYNAAEVSCNSSESNRLQSLLVDADMAEEALQALYDRAAAEVE